MAPTDEELLELMPQGFRDDLALVSRMASHGAGPEVQPGLFRVTLNTGALDYARAVWDRARAALAQPEPEVVGPSVEELDDLFNEIDQSGEPLSWRAYARAVLSRWGRPAPAPAEGEVAELVASLRDAAASNERIGATQAAVQLTRAADLLEQRQAAPVPVAVSERPWEREGWCDEQGQCWVGDPGGGGFIPSWRLCRPEDAPNMKVSLPANALPLPSGEVG